MRGRPPIKGKRHFVKHKTDSGRSPEYPDCIFRNTESKAAHVVCGHIACDGDVTFCYVRHFTAKNTGMGAFTNGLPCPYDRERKA